LRKQLQVGTNYLLMMDLSDELNFLVIDSDKDMDSLKNNSTLKIVDKKKLATMKKEQKEKQKKEKVGKRQTIFGLFKGKKSKEKPSSVREERQ